MDSSRVLEADFYEPDCIAATRLRLGGISFIVR